MEIIIDRNAERYYKSCLQYLLPVKPLPLINGFEIKLGTYHYLFRGSETPFNNTSSAGISDNKYCTNKLLEMSNIPVPKGIILRVNEFENGLVEDKISNLNFPLVVKPLVNGAKGTDVLCNIQTIEQLHTVLHHHFLLYQYVLIEEFHGGLKSYRVLVFNKKVVGVVLRFPASVVGDGIHTINELVVLTNEQRKANNALGPIVIDEESHIRLRELGITADHIPLQGERVVLCYTSNATRGGLYKSLGTKICKKNRQLMIRVASTLNMTLTGIDVECTDINIPFELSKGVVIEVNQRPSVRIHELPISGKPVPVTRKIIRSFIYRHPFLYLHALYSNKRTAVYFRTCALGCLFVIIYHWVLQTPR